MKYIGKTAKSKLDAKELEEIADVIEISDEAMAIVEEINKGFERLRISNLMKK